MLSNTALDCSARNHCKQSDHIAEKAGGKGMRRQLARSSSISTAWCHLCIGFSGTGIQESEPTWTLLNAESG